MMGEAASGTSPWRASMMRAAGLSARITAWTCASRAAYRGGQARGLGGGIGEGGIDVDDVDDLDSGGNGHGLLRGEEFPFACL
ncbi:MAG: hypothetical protein EOP37_00910 [Rubrivivax sp.]|nr:MAG: hypothetical protein EOP37_00910 [Rubrivivax sp.]